ncbi:neutral zinc metallopeptidase [Microbispora sp. H10670]|uniref:neutral zinc metallopeptidase n=1 Tax=Microbispora sp. H10670 TaxID=2729108 RepID=UPI0016014394|nr:neutral zinc metallopeptidase [Microbispora sp. H10670]
MTRRAFAAFFLLVTLVASCGTLAGSPPPDRAQQGDTTSRATPCKGTGDDFPGDVKLARCLTEWFWADRFRRSGETYRPITRFVAYEGNDGPDCGGQPAVPENAFYCPDGHFVAYDAAWLKGMYDQMGDGAVYVVIPHELGHAVQAQLVDDFRYNVQRELQADCYAGATLGGLIQARALRAEEGDEEELLVNLEAAGDPTDAWWAPDAHGTPQQRQGYFAQGYNEGVGAC